MNESANRYFIKNTKDGDFVDTTTLFDGVGVLKLEGMLNKGKPVNVYSEQWVNTQDEDFMITSSQEGVTKIIHENQDVSLTFIVRQTYAENQIDVQTVHDDFVAYLTGSDIWIRSNYVGGKMVHCVCLESYEPTTVSLQRGLKSYIMGTIKLHSLGGAFDYFISGNLVRVALASQVDGLVKGKPYTNYLVYSENNGLVSVTILMGGTDITSTAYNRATKEINIPQVLGNVVINAESSPKIVFADQNVKSLCVTNWGGNYLQNEITEWEAAQVTSLNAVFMANTQITSFDELRFFTGLTRFNTNTGSSSQGEFYNCRNLTSIVLPQVTLTENVGYPYPQAMFRYCPNIPFVDLSPVQSSSRGFCLYHTFHLSSALQSSVLKKVILPKGAYYSSAENAFAYQKGLTTIEIDGTADWSEITALSNAFNNCTALTTITGTIYGISVDISFQYSPLDKPSALMLLNGLAQVTTAKKITFKYSTYNLLTDADIAIATAKSWQVETIIEWEDNNLRDYILAQFSNNVGLTYSGQITNLELASITSLNGKFRGLEYFDENNTKPFYTFNELRFCIGLTTLSSVTSETYSGDFWNCTNLESVTIPKANISSMLSAFHRCVKLSGTLDLSPLSPVSNIDMGRVAQSASNTNTLNVVVLPSGTYSSTVAMFARRTGLHTISIDGVADFSGCSYASTFAYCSALEHITGTIVGIENNISFSDSPKLTRESLLVIINGLAQVETQKTLTLHATAKERLTEDDIAIATAKNWTIK